MKSCNNSPTQSYTNFIEKKKSQVEEVEQKHKNHITMI